MNYNHYQNAKLLAFKRKQMRDQYYQKYGKEYFESDIDNENNYDDAVAVMGDNEVSENEANENETQAQSTYSLPSVFVMFKK